MAKKYSYIKNITGNTITIMYHENGNNIVKDLYSQDSIKLELDQCDEIQNKIGESVISVQSKNL